MRPLGCPWAVVPHGLCGPSPEQTCLCREGRSFEIPMSVNTGTDFIFRVHRSDKPDERETLGSEIPCEALREKAFFPYFFLQNAYGSLDFRSLPIYYNELCAGSLASPLANPWSHTGASRQGVPRSGHKPALVAILPLMPAHFLSRSPHAFSGRRLHILCFPRLFRVHPARRRQGPIWRVYLQGLTRFRMISIRSRWRSSPRVFREAGV